MEVLIFPGFQNCSKQFASAATMTPTMKMMCLPKTSEPFFCRKLCSLRRLIIMTLTDFIYDYYFNLKQDVCKKYMCDSISISLFRAARMPELEKYLKSMPCTDVAPAEHGTQLLDDLLVKEIEREIARVTVCLKTALL